jgi:hypothetical protein
MVVTHRMLHGAQTWPEDVLFLSNQEKGNSRKHPRASHRANLQQHRQDADACLQMRQEFPRVTFLRTLRTQLELLSSLAFL